MPWWWTTSICGLPPIDINSYKQAAVGDSGPAPRQLAARFGVAMLVLLWRRIRILNIQFHKLKNS
jgi:hypothetical protein